MEAHRKRVVLAAASLAIVVVGLACALLYRRSVTQEPRAIAVARAAPGPLVPAHGVLLGAFTPDAAGPAGLSNLERDLGTRFDLDLRFHRFRDPFPTASERGSAGKGRVLVETWMPYDTTLADIASGREDDVLRARGRDIAALGKPVMVRFGHEMNGGWYPWAGDPATYVAAWRRVRSVVRAAGADNAVWVWSPNWRSHPDSADNAAARYYPGDDQVDWVGIDGYAGTRGLLDLVAPPPSLAQLVTPLYNAYARTKPIMVAETGTSLTGGAAKAWTAAAARTVERLPGLVGVVLFDAKGRHDWRIEANRARFRGWQAFVSSLAQAAAAR